MEKNKIITGVSASKGKARGRVRIILKDEDYKKFKNGDVIVTNLTIPEHAIYVRQASAVVLDKGGITCHFAKKARELKKPCLVNASTATKILKDNDLVEVDADKGTIRILNI